MNPSLTLDSKNSHPRQTDITTAIILAGGLGTRLRPAISGLPKCLAPVAGIPFIEYVLRHFQNQGIEDFIFATGYQSGMIAGYLQNRSPQINYILSNETVPLGTGGAIRLAAGKCTKTNTLIINGDTLFAINVNQLANIHLNYAADCTLTLKPMNNFDRYGVVKVDTNHSIKSFKEKQFYKTGLINGGVYALNVPNFLNENLPEIFSFEKDYLEKKIGLQTNGVAKIFSVIQDSYFIDIGIPEDYERAQIELKIKN